jgi:hypothetical protein
MKPPKAIVVEPKAPPDIKGITHLPVPVCYIRHAYMNRKTGTVVHQSVICRKK